jgi:mono/diheme cytochrome c family protein
LHAGRVFAATANLPLTAGPTFAQQPDATPEAEIGMHLFLSTGCGACHRIAGLANGSAARKI